MVKFAHGRLPQVSVVVVGLLVDHLRGHVERRPLDGGEHESVDRQVPREPEVAELGDAVGVDQNVLGLDVAMQDPVRVEVVEGGDQVDGDLLDPRLRQAAPEITDLEKESKRISLKSHLQALLLI